MPVGYLQLPELRIGGAEFARFDSRPGIRPIARRFLTIAVVFSIWFDGFGYTPFGWLPLDEAKGSNFINTRFAESRSMSIRLAASSYPRFSSNCFKLRLPRRWRELQCKFIFLDNETLKTQFEKNLTEAVARDLIRKVNKFIVDHGRRT